MSHGKSAIAIIAYLALSRGISALPVSTSFGAMASIPTTASSISSSVSAGSALISTPVSATASLAGQFAQPQPTVLAFELATTDRPLSASELQAAAAAPNSTAQTFFIAYENAWNTSVDSLSVSLPNITSLRGDSIEGIDGQGVDGISAQGVMRAPHGYGNSTLSYRLFFPLDFDFSKDARLPSIYSGRMGCANCFSTRVRYNPDGTGEMYLYNPTLKQAESLCNTPPLSICDQRGLHIGKGSWTFQKGKWMTIRQDLWLNSPGQSDGGFNIWIDDTLVLSSSTVHYTDHGRICPINNPGLRAKSNEMFDACLPIPRARWTFAPAIRKPWRPVLTVPKTRVIIQPTTIIQPAVTVTQGVTITQAITVVQPVTQTKIDQIIVPTTLPVTETATITVTESAPLPTDPPVEDVPVEEPPADEEPAPEDPPAEEEAVLLKTQSTPVKPVSATMTPRAGLAQRDDGMWKGLNGYPGDAGYKAGPVVANGYPYTFTLQQVVTLPAAPVATVTITKAKTITKTAAATPTPPKKKP